MNFKVLPGAAFIQYTLSKERAGAIFGLKCLTLKGALVRIHLTV